MTHQRSGRAGQGTFLRMAGMTAFLLPAFLLFATPAKACHEYVSPSDGATGCGAFNRDLGNGTYQNGSSSGGSGSSGSSSGSGSSGSGSSGSSGGGSGDTGNVCT